MTELETLKYIAGSPKREHGGFHENTVAAAEWAVNRIAELEADITEKTLELCDMSRENEDLKHSLEWHRKQRGGCRTCKHFSGIRLCHDGDTSDVVRPDDYCERWEENNNEPETGD